MNPVLPSERHDFIEAVIPMRKHPKIFGQNEVESFITILMYAPKYAPTETEIAVRIKGFKVFFENNKEKRSNDAKITNVQIGKSITEKSLNA